MNTQNIQPPQLKVFDADKLWLQKVTLYPNKKYATIKILAYLEIYVNHICLSVSEIEKSLHWIYQRTVGSIHFWIDNNAKRSSKFMKNKTSVNSFYQIIDRQRPAV